MFDIGYSELALVAIVALVVIGPKDLPRAMRFVGQWVGKGRAMARHVRAGFDEMVRQAEMEEMEKQWRDHNEKIMAATPKASDFDLTPAAKPALPPTALPSAAEAPVSDVPAEGSMHDGVAPQDRPLP